MLLSDFLAEEKPKKRYKQRSPLLKTQKIIDAGRTFIAKYGREGRLHEFAAVLGNSERSSVFKQKLYDFKRFNLLVTFGEQVRFTPLGVACCTASDDGSYGNSIQFMIAHLIPLRKLWIHCAGQPLSSREEWSEILKRNAKVPNEFIEEWITYIAETCLYSGVVKSIDGVLSFIPAPENVLRLDKSSKTIREEFVSVSKGTLSKPVSQVLVAAGPKPIQADSPSGMSMNKPLTHGVFNISHPSSLTEEDIDKIRVILQAVSLSLDAYKVH